MSDTERERTHPRPWVRPMSFKEWKEAWDDNHRGKRSFGLARDLLFSLPGLVTRDSEDEEKCRLIDFYGALSYVMDITMYEPDNEVAERAQRATNLLLKRILNEQLSLPEVYDDPRPGRYWRQSEYRRLPKSLLRFYSHPRSYAVGTEVDEKNARNWVQTLILLEQERLDSSEFTQAFDWPDIRIEPCRTQFLRNLILVPDQDRDHEFPGLLPDYFELLVDARDSWLAKQDNYPRKPSGRWPEFDHKHSVRLNFEIYQLGVELGMPPDRIKPLPFR